MTLRRPGPWKPLSTLAAWRRGLYLRGAASIRRKLILLHTVFSLVVAASLLLALRAPIRDLLEQEEVRECRLALQSLAGYALAGRGGTPDPGVPGVEFVRAAPERSGLEPALVSRALAAPGTVVESHRGADSPSAALYLPATNELLGASVRSPEARAAVNRVYLLLTVALLGVYGFIALAIEVFVLPRQVYGPIARLREADEAVREGRREGEIIDERYAPADELGDIMRSRNRTVIELRRQEAQLEDALLRLESVATELRRKNELLEAARRNLADQDRLASLGMMSAGIAHELNTPLSVLKGCVESLQGGGPVDPERAALMLRVVSRLERLSEGLLDFARVRPASVRSVPVPAIVAESWSLVSLDRDARGVSLVTDFGVPEVFADGDRLTQVFVNLLRNAVDAMESGPGGSIEVRSRAEHREGRDWACVTVADSGPGIEPSLFPRLFEPFASTRLDSSGTGLGLAVAEGIVREHGGVLLARMADPSERSRGFTGAVFEMLLPMDTAGTGLFEGEPGAVRVTSEPR